MQFLSTRRNAGLLCGALLLAFCTCALAENVTMRFNPPNGLSYIETSTMKVTRESSAKNDGAGSQAEISKRRVTIHKTKAGYTVDFTPFQVTRIRNGKTVQTLSEADLRKAAMTLVLDAKGRCIDVKGASIENAVGEAMKQMTPEMRKKFTIGDYRKRLIEQYKSQWEEEVGKSIGTIIPVGTTETKTETKRLEVGVSAKTLITKKYAGHVNVHGQDCLRVTETQQADTKSLVAAVKKAMQSSKAKQPMQLLGMQYRYEHEYVVNPSVLLNYSESAISTITSTTSTPKGKATLKMVRSITRSCELK